jgi:hypothetical protein
MVRGDGAGRDSALLLGMMNHLALVEITRKRERTLTGP